MKKLDFFFFMVLLGAIGMVGCTQQSSVSEPADKTAEIELSISKAEMLKSGAFDDQEGGPYCDATFTEEQLGTVVIAWSVSLDGNDWISQKAIEWTNYSLNQEVIFGKITLDWGVLNVPATQTFIQFRVDNVKIKDGENTDYLFVTPTSDALYASYISDESDRVGYVYTLDLYEKEHAGVKVLCFNKQEIPKFGFDWFDFEIITGEEVCLWFNCQNGTTDIDKNPVHYNVTTDYFASFVVGIDAEGKKIWKNYWEALDTYNLNCIPLPANYAEYGIKVKAGLKEVEVTSVDIAKFLDKLAYSRVTADYEVSVDSDSSGAYFLHYVFYDCDYKDEEP